jgi:hypothetical protein
MSVFQRKDRDGTWTYDFWLKGERYKTAALNTDDTPCKNKTEAKAAEQRAKARAAEDKAATRVRPNVSLVRTRRARPTLATA